VRPQLRKRISKAERLTTHGNVQGALIHGQEWRDYLEADDTLRGVCWKSFLVSFGKIHAVGELQTGDLPGVKLHFQVSRQNGDMNRFPFRRRRALGTDAVEFHIPVVGLDEFVDDRVHGPSILALGIETTNRSKTLEACLVSFSLVTLLSREVTLPSNRKFALKPAAR
jgi:hypothetical protein